MTVPVRTAQCDRDRVSNRNHSGVIPDNKENVVEVCLLLFTVPATTPLHMVHRNRRDSAITEYDRLWYCVAAMYPLYAPLDANRWDRFSVVAISGGSPTDYR